MIESRPSVRMPRLPQADDSLVVRTHYGDEGRWIAMREAIATPVGDYRAYVRFVEDPGYADASIADLIDAAVDVEGSFIFVADKEAIERPDYPLLVVDLVIERGRTFRVVPAWTWAVENNLSMGTEGFDDFLPLLDADRVFRGSDGVPAK